MTLLFCKYDLTPVLELFAISPPCFDYRAHLLVRKIVPFSFRPSTQRRLAKGLSPSDETFLERRNGVR